MIDVLARAADKEGEIAMHPVMTRASPSSAKASSVTVSGLVFGISNTPVTPPKHRAARSGFEIFLMRQAGLAEMHLRVDHAGQDMQALAIDHFAGRWRRRAIRFARSGRR
jgi:hypothetical protein